MLIDLFEPFKIEYTVPGNKLTSFGAGDAYGKTIVHGIVNGLVAAGWTLLSSAESWEEQIVWNAPISDTSIVGAPIAIPSGACYWSPRYTLTIPGFSPANFIYYDPRRYDAGVATCLDTVVFVPLGDTQSETIVNLADALSTSVFLVQLLPVPLNMQNSHLWQSDSRVFRFTPHAGGIDFDNYLIQGGESRVIDPIHGSSFTGASVDATHDGSFTLQSAALNGGTITVVVSNTIINPWGDRQDLHFAKVEVYPSGGGYFAQGISNTRSSQRGYFPYYNMIANPYQFVIWPNGFGYGGPDLSMLLVSMLATDTARVPEAILNPVICIASSGIDGAQINFGQMRNRMFWPRSVASGWSNHITATTYFNGSDTTGFSRKPTCALMGLRGSPLLTRMGLPLIQNAYIAMSDDPANGAIANRIAGKLWGSVVMSEGGYAKSYSASPNKAQTSFPFRYSTDPTWEEKMTFDNRQWIMISDSHEPGGDINGSLWMSIE
jgi:hypothetical protein